MANGFGSLYVGSSGLRSAQNALNVVANNLSNVDTKSYVRQRTVFEDQSYNSFGTASVSAQSTGLGVGIGDVIHARDQFLDRAYRTESGRQAFYAANYDATSEVETLLQESTGETFGESINDLYVAFSEFAKDPSNTTNMNLISQKASLFVSRSAGVYDGLKDYQANINTKVSDDVDRINELGDTIHTLNNEIQRIEAGGVETAMTLRDQRDAAVDELSSLANITYGETSDGILKVKLEGVDFVVESRSYSMGVSADPTTGFYTPYWNQLSNPSKKDYYSVFNLDNIDPTKNTDVGEIKGLLLSRGNAYSTYMDMTGLTSEQYDKTLSNSVMSNSEAELDTLVHTLTTSINDLLSPIKNYSGAATTGVDKDGNTVAIDSTTRIFDEANASVGADGVIPTQELFSRTGCDRYTKITLADGSTVYKYNEEDPKDTSTCYTLNSLKVNQQIVEDVTKIPHMKQNGDVDYALGNNIYQLWETSDYTLNPSDKSPCSIADFYNKMVGEMATTGSVYKTTSESLTSTKASIESNRQAVIGVSSDEELTNMIKYQNAYNASSRYMNVVSQMIDYLLSSLQ